MQDIKLPNILRIPCKVIGHPHESRRFNPQTIEATSSPSCRTNRTMQNDTDKGGTHDNNKNMPDYLRSSTSKAADERESEVLTNEIYSYLSNIARYKLFQG